MSYSTMLKRVAVATFLELLFASSALASTDLASEPWYKVATGLVAIPAAILGLLFSYRLLKKTNLESRKLELEILEKQKTLESPPDPKALSEHPASAPIFNSERLALLLLRFIMLEMTLRIWQFVPSVASYITMGATYSLFWLLPKDGPLSAIHSSTAAVVLGQGVHLLFDVVYWFIVFGFGWPLLKDASSMLGIRMDGMFDLPRLGKKTPTSQ